MIMGRKPITIKIIDNGLDIGKYHLDNISDFGPIFKNLKKKEKGGKL
jgi:hypothetical protein